MTRWARILKHRWWDETDTARAVPPAALARIEAQVAASEAVHRGEIRVCVEASLPLSYLWRGLSVRDRAIMMFSKLRVWDTAANTGVLIYVLLAERAIEIVADRGLNQHVSTAQWQALLERMRPALHQGDFERGLSEAVREVGRLLDTHHPLRDGPADRDELPNAPYLG